MKHPIDVMAPATAQLFARLQTEPLLSPFVLIGGTALALHLGHRRSDDLDFISTSHKLPRRAIATLTRELERAGLRVTEDVDPAAYDDFSNAGMQLKDYSQSFVVGGEVKLTFFVADRANSKVLDQQVSAGAGPRIAALAELSDLKALVAASRSNSRDWLDLYILAKEHGFSLDQWKAAYDKAELTGQHFEVALDRICSGVLPKTDTGFNSLLPNPPAVAEIAEYFKAARESYEQGATRKVMVKDPGEIAPIPPKRSGGIAD